MPNDFVVMDIEADVRVSIILGRPFLATAGAGIDVREGLLNLTIGDAEVEFQFNKTMKWPSMDEMVEKVLKVDEVAEIVEKPEEDEACAAAPKTREELKAKLKDELIEELNEMKKE